MINWNAVIFGFLLAAIDTVVFPTLKLRFINYLHGNWPLIISFFLYGIQALLFYYTLRFESMAVMNVIWNMASNLTVTIIGILALKEVVSMRKMVGIILSFVCLYLLSS
jgi:multidrug transporter EmrE-like cation transporter